MIASAAKQYFENSADGRVLAAYLFGSHAAGRAHRESDVDIAILLDRSRLPDQASRDDAQIRLANDLIAALHCNNVDLVILNDAPPLLARSILRTGELLFSADHLALRDFERDTQLLAADLEPFIQRGRRRLAEVLRR